MTLPFLQRVMRTQGITEHDLYKLLSDDNTKGVMTDETIYSVVKYINSVKTINVFLTRKIGSTEIRPKWFDQSVDFQMINEDHQVTAAVCLQLVYPYKFHIEFPILKRTILINLDLLDYDGGKDAIMDLRMRVLNEILTRYYSKTLYTIYQELNRRR